ncbi:hypothetical protein [Alishewanella longhuensis]|jgi:major membrane immunogen (membrane-anchored lipoprotein)
MVKNINMRIVLVLVSSAFLFSCGKSNMCESEGMAYVMSQKYVKNNLKSPSSAKFPHSPTSSNYIGSCTHVVTGSFEASNSFGAMMRSTYKVTMKYNEQNKTWSGSDLTID